MFTNCEVPQNTYDLPRPFLDVFLREPEVGNYSPPKQLNFLYKTYKSIQFNRKSKDSSW